jgi:hypothetical protein
MRRGAGHPRDAPGSQIQLRRLEDKGDIDPDHIEFWGFDGNEESWLLGYCRHVCTPAEECYTELSRGRDNFNSHAATLDGYRRMPEVWRRLEKIVLDATAWRKRKSSRSSTRDPILNRRWASCGTLRQKAQCTSGNELASRAPAPDRLRLPCASFWSCDKKSKRNPATIPTQCN